MSTRNFRELLRAMPLDRHQTIERQFEKSLASVPLDQPRQARNQMTQLQLGDAMGLNQGEISRIEHREDKEVRISQFDELPK